MSVPRGRPEAVGGTQAGLAVALHQTAGRLLDHLVGAREQREQDAAAELLERS
jgi:hypothetical protein